MSKRLEPADCGAQGDLERALSDVGGVAEVLMELGVQDDVAGYLGGMLKGHYDTALDAFRRVYGLDEYRPQGKDHAAKAAAVPPPDAATRQALRKLVDKWDTEASGDRDGAA
jgi:hypothetical protein